MTIVKKYWFEMKIQAFTLVELIVVITILAILWTIGFISLQWYSLSARDSRRISDISTVEKSLWIYNTTQSTLPSPDRAILITGSWNALWYQWFLWTGVLNELKMWGEILDPLYLTPFIYSTDVWKSRYQIMAYMEKSQLLVDTVPETYALVWDYTNSFPKFFWERFFVLLEPTSQKWIHEILTAWDTLDLNANNNAYSIYLTNSDSFTWSWYSLYWYAATILGEYAPNDCPSWFIWVPWNIEFHPEWFCVAQYEMTYSDANVANSVDGWTDFNSVSYIPGKKIVSQAWTFPIWDITQWEAIEACKTIGNGFHLITENEWMTIARSIEANKENWTWNEIGNWFIPNWVSNNTDIWCYATASESYDRVFATKTWKWVNETCNSRRSHTLQNENIIWDFAWNLWENVNKANTIDGVGYNIWNSTLSSSDNATWWDLDGVYARSEMNQSASFTNHGLWEWVWSVYNSQWYAPNNVFLRWGSAPNDRFPWIYTLNLRWRDIDSEGSVGFRCAR